MLKHHAGEVSPASNEASLTGNNAAGQVAGYRALSGLDQAGARMDSFNTKLAVLDDVFVFAPSWTGGSVDAFAFDGDLSLAYAVGSLAVEAPALAEADSATTSADIPIWGLASDDFSFI